MKRIEGDDHTHDAVWEIIPWYVNETLGRSERDMVENHLRQCPACRREVEAQARLRNAIRVADTEHRQTDSAWEALDRRLDNASSRRPWLPVGAGLAASVAVLALGVVLIDDPQDRPGFVTLTDDASLPEAAEAQLLRIRLAPGASEAEAIALLNEIGLTNVASPSETGLIAAVVPEHLDAATLADRLMKDPAFAYVAGDF